jgi:primosomal protein N' (replication factor Y)
MVQYQTGDRVGVLTTQPLGRILDYRAPEGGCGNGDYVEVPLGPRKVLGVVWNAGSGDFDAAKLRSISRVLDIAPMLPTLRQFIERAADYTLTPLPAMLRLATRAPGLGNAPSMRKIYRLGNTVPNRLTDARTKVMDVLRANHEAAFTLGELAAMAAVSHSVVKGLVGLGALIEQDTPRDLPFADLDFRRPGKALNADQQNAADILRSGIKSDKFGTTLLKGVTGSGKTEVYLEAVAACLAQGRQALVLLPEIALTAEFLDRVEVRFGARPAEWHSGVTMTARRRVFRMVGEGNAQMVVGARSALFLPFQDLGLIVVDEEHDGSYKQEDGVLYNARDMAVLRGALCDAQVVLASATPALETWANADSGKYARVDLASRFGVATLPEMRAIDMRNEVLDKGTWISPSLRNAIAARVTKGEQSLLFLNRRGYAPVTLCRACGEQVACQDCDARMVEHRFLGRLICHQCGANRAVPDICPACQVEGKMTAVGPGVERITEEAQTAFPDAKVAVLSSDMFGTARELKAQIEQIANGDADIVVGTQLVAKGHNFPKLTLVGVIDADLGLQGSDLRAAEKSFQLMRQVAGRAGRAQTAGVAMLQTFQPEHPVIQAILNGDEEAFWQAEAAARAAAGTPPFGRMAGVILSGSNPEMVNDLGMYLVRNAGALHQVGAKVYGPAPAPIARVRGRHRVRLLVKADKGVPLQRALRAWTSDIKLRSDLRLAIDIDPQSFF